MVSYALLTGDRFSTIFEHSVLSSSGIIHNCCCCAEILVGVEEAVCALVDLEEESAPAEVRMILYREVRRSILKLKNKNGR